MTDSIPHSATHLDTYHVGVPSDRHCIAQAFALDARSKIEIAADNERNNRTENVVCS
jgi:hypothetical protein